jgi:glutamine synthetase
MTKDILFNNSNVLYDLRYEAVFDETLQLAPKQLTYNPRPDGTSPYRSPIGTPGPSLSLFNQPATSTQASRSVSPYSQPPAFPPPPKVPQVYDTALFSKFVSQNPGLKFIYIQWLDYMATIRSRIVPVKEFTRMIQEGTRIAISQGTLQNDHLTPIANTAGQIYIEPDLRSLRVTHNKDPLPSATVLSYQRSEDGHAIPSDPRHALETLINGLQYNHSTTLLVGFEIEVVFLSRNPPSTTTNLFAAEPYAPLTKTHAWGTLPPEQWLQLPFLSEILLALEEMGIEIQQFHAESGQGQYNFVMPPQPPLLAIDSLVQARQTIAQIASLHGLRATLHPKPFEGVNTAANVNMSLHPPDRDMQFFVGGVLRHLPAICAFSMPEEVSYSRVGDDSWFVIPFPYITIRSTSALY